MNFRIDNSTAVTLVLFLISNCIAIQVGREGVFTLGNDQNRSWSEWKALNPEYLKGRWLARVTESNIGPLGNVIRAIAWCSLILPVTEIAWIQSKGFKRGWVLHVFMVVLVMSGAFAELIGRFMVVGIEDATRNVIGNYELDDWETALDGNVDGMGWRVIDMGHMVIHGVLLWIDAFEWLCLFGFLVLVYVSVGNNHETFSTKWATLGLLIAILSVADLAANVVRMESWLVGTQASLALTALNTIIFIPIWLLWLAIQLPYIRDNSELFDQGNIGRRREKATDPAEVGEQDSSVDYANAVTGFNFPAEVPKNEAPQQEGVDDQMNDFASKLASLADEVQADQANAPISDGISESGSGSGNLV